MLTKMMATRVQVILLSLFFAFLGVSTANAQSRLEAARAKERELDRRAAQVDPDSRDADRIYRDAADATRARERLERQGNQRSETNRSALEVARERERESNAAAQRVDPDSRDADRTYRDAANATRARERLEQQERQQVNRRDNPLPYSSLGGSPHYYNGRSIDYTVRNGRRDPYYKPYGEKYYNRYTNEVSRTLTPRGQEFIRQVGPRMQSLIEERRSADPAGFARMERNPAAFGRFITEIHRQAYYESGWADLPGSDQRQIIGAIDLGDWKNQWVRDAARALAPGTVGINPTQPERQQYNQPRGVPRTTRDGRHYRF